MKIKAEAHIERTVHREDTKILSHKDNLCNSVSCSKETISTELKKILFDIIKRVARG